MERIRNLDRYQKGILLILVAMAVAFAGVYALVTSRVGYLYNDQILEPVTENGNNMYRAEVQGEEWCFTVTPDKTVTFRCGDKTYGPYTAKEDPTAVPKDHTAAGVMTGVVVMEGDKILFRGGIMSVGQADSHWLMIDEDGIIDNITAYAVSGNGTILYPDGYDPLAPSASTVLRLMEGPELTHKGVWFAWFAGAVISVICTVSILFADELFRWKLMFRVQDAYLVEPSDWEIACRYIGWTLMTVLAFAAFIIGLK